MSVTKESKKLVDGAIVVIDLGCVPDAWYIGRYRESSHTLQDCVLIGPSRRHADLSSNFLRVPWSERVEELELPQLFGDLEGRSKAYVYIISPQKVVMFRRNFQVALEELLTSSVILYSDPDVVVSAFQCGDTIPWCVMAEDLVARVAQDLRFNHGETTYMKFVTFAR